MINFVSNNLLFTHLKTVEIRWQYEKIGKYWSYCTQNRAIIMLFNNFISFVILEANLALLGVSVQSQYLLRLLSFCWITHGHTIHQPIKGLLPPIGIDPTPFRNSAILKLLVHVTTPGFHPTPYCMNVQSPLPKSLWAPNVAGC